MKIGLCLKNSDSYESKRLIEEAHNLSDDPVILTDSNVSNLAVILEEGKTPKVFMNHKDISNLDKFLIRSTSNYRAVKTVLAKSLALCGCDTIDNPDNRLSIGYASKICSTIERFKQDSGVSSYLIFSTSAMEDVIEHLKSKNIDKVLFKPVVSSQSRGIKEVPVSELFDLAYNFNFYKSRDVVPILLQDIIDIELEYRVIVKNGKVIGAFKKKRYNSGNITYIRKRFKRLERFVAEKVSDEGILGVDACKATSGKLYVIENNRSPMFEAAEKYTRINIAREFLL